MTLTMRFSQRNFVVFTLLAASACSREPARPSTRPPVPSPSASTAVASPPCTQDAARQIRNARGEQPLLRTALDGSYFYDMAEMLGCADDLGLVEASHMSGSFWDYYIVEASAGSWQIRADGSAWKGAPQTSAVFPPEALTEVGLDPTRVTHQLGSFATRPLLGTCLATMVAAC
jgi:hypothetical protein